MPFALYNTNDEVDTLAESMDTPTVEKPAESAQPAPAGKPSALPEDEILSILFDPKFRRLECCAMLEFILSAKI